RVIGARSAKTAWRSSRVRCEARRIRRELTHLGWGLGQSKARECAVFRRRRERQLVSGGFVALALFCLVRGHWALPGNARSWPAKHCLRRVGACGAVVRLGNVRRKSWASQRRATEREPEPAHHQ